MAWTKYIAGRPQIDHELVDLAWIHHLRRFLRITIAGANDTFGEVLSESIRPNVDQLSSEIGVYG